MSAPAIRPVLVTGATGFVGAWLVRDLVKAGHEVHALTRPSSPRGHLAREPVMWHEGDVVDPEAVLCAVRAAGAEALVVHAAASISYRRRDRARAFEVNVEGTRNVLDACRAVGVHRLCHVSSVVAVGTAPDARSVIDEDHPFDDARLGVAYVDSKRAAEELVLESADALDVVVVNPGAIFGPSMRGPGELSNTMRFVRAVAGGMWLPAAPGSLAVVGVDDVVAGLRAALELGAPGRRYLLTESNRTHAELVDDVRAALGRGPAQRCFPGGAWRVLTGAVGALEHVLPLSLATRESLALLGEHYRFDSSRARAELGWSPSPFAEVLADTLDWMRSARVIG